MAPRPGMPHMAPAPTAGPIPSRPAVPAAQPAVTKPLFPSAAQVGIVQILTHACTHTNIHRQFNHLQVSMKTQNSDILYKMFHLFGFIFFFQSVPL